MKSAKGPRIAIVLMVLSSLILSIALLWSVRLSYSGVVYDGTDLLPAVDMQTRLPVFSDEWIMAGYVQKSVERGTLPTFHPLDDVLPAAENPLVFMILTLAGIMKATGLDIVTQNIAYVFVFQAAFVITFFFFLRACRISMISSLIGVLILLFLPESNIMQGIWIMLPAYIGAIFLMIAFTMTGRPIAWLPLLIGCLLYPPYLVLSSIYFFLTCIGRRSVSRLLIAILVLGIIGIIFLKTMNAHVSLGNIPLLWDSFLRIVIHPRFGISTVSVWTYLPVLFYVVGIIGTWMWFADERRQIGKNKKAIMAFCIMFAGLLLMLVYCFDIEFILSHQRVVFFSWLILIAMAVFFLDICHGLYKNNKNRSKNDPENEKNDKRALIIALSILITAQTLLILSGTYPRLVPWQGIETRREVFLETVSAQPVMKRMLPDNFESIIESGDKKTRLLAPPYPALAIAAVTNMSPVSTVDSIVSVQGVSYADFEQLPDCDSRYSFAKKVLATHLLIHVSKSHLMQGCDRFDPMTPIGDRYFMYSVK